MRRLMVFNHVTIDGYFTDLNNDMSWAHTSDPEWNAFVAENSQGEAEALYGRVTYEMMASYWPTPAAKQMFPDLAERMNSMPKVVFSRTLDQATWSNTRLVKSGLAEEVRRMKREPGPMMLIMGSGTLVAQLTQEHLIDEYQIITDPLVLGAGKSMFAGLKEKQRLKQIRTRTFKNGNLLTVYESLDASK